MPETKKLQVFLCHASLDKPQVRELYKYLRRRGIAPWLDAEDLLPGQDWQVEIPQALLASDAIIVCLSKNSVTKEGYVQKEIAFALDKAQEKPEGAIFIIPAKLEECDVPARLSRYHWVDLHQPGGYQRLMRGLKRRAEQLQRGHVDEAQPVSSPALGKSTAEVLKNDEAEKRAVEQAEAEKLAAQQVEQERLAREKAERDQHAQLARAKTWASLKTPALLLGGLLLVGVSGLALWLVARPFFPTMSVPTLTPEVLVTQTPQATFTPATTETLQPATFTFTPIPPTDIPFTPTPIPAAGDVMVSEKDGMKLHYVPAGPFTMGSDNGQPNEKPAHTVTLDAFWIDETEVTNLMYKLCVAAGKCPPPSNKGSYTRISYYDGTQYVEYPVTYVFWNDATAYCVWAGRALPSEAQWEKAARGPNGNTYPWGNAAPDKNLLNYNKNVGDTTQVGLYPNGKSFYGAYDMAGNVWEWVADWYDRTYYARSPSSNPLGPDSGGYTRVLRGGSWTDYGAGVRLSIRYFGQRSNSNIGFRCALSQ
jgi:formylglycine-generating enzyme required for sulfatase activity